MSAQVVKETEESLQVLVTIPRKGSMLEREQAIRAALNEAGALATGRALADFDTDGRPLKMGDVTWYAKEKTPETYQTPYGTTETPRFTYQTSKGGRTFCPMEQAARVVLTATPMFARILAHKYAEMGSTAVLRDLAETHDRTVARSFLQNVVEFVAATAQAKEEVWEYAPPELDEPVRSISLSLDGTMLLMTNGAYRETMIGTISLYGRDAERSYTIYIAAPPEYGRETFLGKLEESYSRVKEMFPKAKTVGVADGSLGNWTFLKPRTALQIVDFWHAAEYLGKAASTYFGRDEKRRKAWTDDACHELKHTPGKAKALALELAAWDKEKNPEGADDEDPIHAAARFFANQHHRMDYPAYRTQGLPIGSGVTEAACKRIVKDRMRGSGMKWKEHGAGVVLTLRTLVYTDGYWSQFWEKVNRFGWEAAA